MEVVGKIKVKGDVQTFGQADKPFLKRELVVTTDEDYPQMIMIEFVQDKCDLLNSYNVGDDVKVSINLRGREWINPEGKAKYFNSVQGWRVEKSGAESSAPAYVAQPVDVASEEPDDLPF